MTSCFRAAARPSVAAAVAVLLVFATDSAQTAQAQTAQAQTVQAQTAPAQTAPAQTAPTQPAASAASTAADPVVARVGGQTILLSDLKEAAQGLPHNAQEMPPEQLYPLLLDQEIDGLALVAEARRTGLDKDPAVQREVMMAEDRALETAVLHRAIAPLVTEAAVRARYDQQIANKPREEEVHARHILVPDEATAKQVIAQLGKGADFAALSKQYSKDPGAAQQGGDLGWFKKSEMVPEFADAAFALQPGQITQTPVHTQFGWHVIQVLARRKAPAPTFQEASAELRQTMIQDYVQQAVAKARAQVKVEKFNLDGSPIRATDTAQPPPNK